MVDYEHPSNMPVQQDMQVLACSQNQRLVNNGPKLTRVIRQVSIVVSLDKLGILPKFPNTCLQVENPHPGPQPINVSICNVKTYNLLLSLTLTELCPVSCDWKR